MGGLKASVLVWQCAKGDACVCALIFLCLFLHVYCVRTSTASSHDGCIGANN